MLGLSGTLSSFSDAVVDYAREDFTRRGTRHDFILDVKTSRSPFAYLRALSPKGTYVTVGGSLSRLFQLLLLWPLISRGEPEDAARRRPEGEPGSRLPL